MKAPLEFTNAADDPRKMKMLMDLIGLFRMSVAPCLNSASTDDEFQEMQPALFSAAIIMGGMGIGHMAVVGALDETSGDIDVARAALAGLFDFGYEQGKHEAQVAMVKAGMAGNA